MRHGIGLIGVILLAACAAAPEDTERKRGLAKFEGDKRLGAAVDSICFASSIDGFNDESRDTVVLREGGDQYLVEIFGSCPALDRAQQIGIDSTSGCLRDGDRLIVSESIGGFGGGDDGRVDRCTIKSIHQWDPKAGTTE